MTKHLILAFLSAPMPMLHAADPSPDPTATPPALTATELCSSLDQQSKLMAMAAQSRDTHTLHKLDAAVNQEVASFLAAQGTALSADQTKLLSDMGAQATAAHHDAHHSEWDQVTAAQEKFEADVKAIRESHLSNP